MPINSFHTLTMFPTLLTYSFLAPFFLRVTIGIIGLLGAKVRLSKNSKWLAPIQAVISVFILMGCYTQIAVILGILISLLSDYLDKKIAPIPKERMTFHILIYIVLVSILFTGPGAFAIDLPL